MFDDPQHFEKKSLFFSFCRFINILCNNCEGRPFLKYKNENSCAHDNFSIKIKYKKGRPQKVSLSKWELRMKSERSVFFFFHQIYMLQMTFYLIWMIQSDVVSYAKNYSNFSLAKFNFLNITIFIISLLYSIVYKLNKIYFCIHVIQVYRLFNFYSHIA